jgi:hypothetical protein
MVLHSVPVVRIALLGVCLVGLVSTGVASSSIFEAQVASGHTAFVEVVVEAPTGESGERSPLVYGLATHRVDYLFGLLSSHRPVGETTDRMVFAWAGPAGDPRGDPTLRPTGDLAQVTDRMGHTWVVFEFSYHGPSPGGLPDDHFAPSREPFKAYGVFPGPLRYQDDGTPYNHVLTYREHALLAPLQQYNGLPEPDAALPQRHSGQQATEWGTYQASGVLEDRVHDVQTVLTGIGPRPLGITPGAPFLENAGPATS